MIATMSVSPSPILGNRYEKKIRVILKGEFLLTTTYKNIGVQTDLLVLTIYRRTTLTLNRENNCRISTTMAAEHFSLESILGLVHERNYRETFPFVSIHDRCNFLEQQVEDGEKRCEDLRRKISSHGDSHVVNTSPSGGPSSCAIGESAALRNERRMREQLEKLEQELKSEKARHEEDVEKMGKCQKELKDLKEVHLVQEQSLIQLQNQIDEKQKSLDHVTSKVEDSQQRTKLAEQQYVGLKETIRTLQDENDEYQKENRELEQRLLSEKERMNSLTDTVEQLKRQLEMFGNLQKQHGTAAVAVAAADSTDRTNVATSTTTSTTSITSSWFGFSSKRTTPTPVSASITGTTGTENSSVTNQQQQQSATKNVVEIKSKPEERRQFGSFSVVVPSEPKQTITAHHGEALCVKYVKFLLLGYTICLARGEGS